MKTGAPAQPHSCPATTHHVDSTCILGVRGWTMCILAVLGMTALTKGLKIYFENDLKRSLEYFFWYKFEIN